jgi:hypothetical protein
MEVRLSKPGALREKGPGRTWSKVSKFGEQDAHFFEQDAHFFEQDAQARCPLFGGWASCFLSQLISG